jgi:hypothetical protein
MGARMLLEDHERWQGTFCKIGDEYVGVYTSDEGPKLFFNREVYSLNEACWDLEMVVGKSTRIFTFYWKGEAVRSFRCPSHIDIFDVLYVMLPRRKQAAAAQ